MFDYRPNAKFNNKYVLEKIKNEDYEEIIENIYNMVYEIYKCHYEAFRRLYTPKDLRAEVAYKIIYVVRNYKINPKKGRIFDYLKRACFNHIKTIFYKRRKEIDGVKIFVNLPKYDDCEIVRKF